jgi:hypothetical protein
MVRRLEATRIVDTAQRLQNRIEERFPGSGLSGVAHDIALVADDAVAIAAWLGRPHRVTRFAGIATALALVAFTVVGALRVHVGTAPRTLFEWVQGIESLTNDVVFVAIAVYFLLGLEARRKRSRTIAALHVLRSLAHIVDMHQLTKDPDRTFVDRLDTASSPKARFSPFELTRYLDYCSELLAILSKIAALYVQELSDAETVSAASAVEELCVGLSRTIWQKIVILDRVLPEDAMVRRVIREK